MAQRAENKLHGNLPLLQNFIKRDPESYKSDFMLQFKNRFQGGLETFELAPDQPHKDLQDIVIFIAHVTHCYPKELESFPQQLIDVLQTHSTVMNRSLRMNFCRALILLRNKELLTPTDLLELFFTLLKCQDKALRKFLKDHIITDIANLNSKHKNAKLNTTLQNFMFTMVRTTNTKAAKMSVDIMIELYNKNIWNDSKTVNVIASACFSKIVKVMIAALKFFLGKDSEEKDSDDSDDEIDTKEVAMANKVNKKSRKREKLLNKVKKAASKAYKKKSKAPAFNFSAIHLIHDPQGMAEKLFTGLNSSNKKFEVKILTLDVISRLIGLHNLFLSDFYSYIQRFLQPHQREVTRILQFTAQASHDLVPPDDIAPVLKILANNFITERNSSDVMAVGLNAVKEICARCPLAMDEDLLRDLAMYKTYRDKSVMMAAKGLIHLFRDTRPEYLHKKDRGRPTEASAELLTLQYGQVDAKDYVPGAEVLLKDENEEIEINSDSEGDESWVDVPHSSDEEGDEGGKEDEEEGEEESEDEGEEESEEEGEEESENDEDGEDPSEEEESDTKKERDEKKVEKSKSKVEAKKKGREKRKEMVTFQKTLAQKVTLDRILTDEDFKRIDMANAKKQVQGTKRKRDVDQPESEFVKLGDIENIYKKRKHDKQTRIESVRAGQTDREKFGYKDGRVNPHCSRTNRERKKNKNFQMIRHKVQGKSKRSFKDKQIALRNYLIHVKKMK